MLRRVLFAAFAVLGFTANASAAPIVAIGGGYVVNNSSSTIIGSTVPFSTGSVTTDGGAGSTLPFSVSPLQLTLASDIKFDLTGLTTNPGPVTANTNTFTLTPVFGTGIATFTWSSIPIFQINSDQTASFLITGVSLVTNTIPSGNADLSLFNDSDNQLRFSVLVSLPNPTDPSIVALSPSSVGNFNLSSSPITNPFGDPIPEPATLATFGFLALAGGYAARRKLKATAVAAV